MIINRRILGLWDVFGKVGGIVNVFHLIAGFVFTWYAEITFQFEAIDTFLEIKTKEPESIKINSAHKIALMSPCCANKKLRRMITRGSKLIDTQMDVVKVLNDVRHL